MHVLKVGIRPIEPFSSVEVPWNRFFIPNWLHMFFLHFLFNLSNWKILFDPCFIFEVFVYLCENTAGISFSKSLLQRTLRKKSGEASHGHDQGDLFVCGLAVGTTKWRPSTEISRFPKHPTDPTGTSRATGSHGEQRIIPKVTRAERSDSESFGTKWWNEEMILMGFLQVRT